MGESSSVKVIAQALSMESVTLSAAFECKGLLIERIWLASCTCLMCIPSSLQRGPFCYLSIPVNIIHDTADAAPTFGQMSGGRKLLL